VVVVTTEQLALCAFAPDTPEEIINRVQRKARAALDQERGLDV